MRSITNKLLSKVLILAMAIMISVTFPGSARALDELFSIGNDIYYYDPDDTCSPATSSGTTQSTGSETRVGITIAQANIKKAYGSTSQADRYRDAMELFSSHNPDFVTLNEIHTPNSQLTYKTYKVFGQQHPDAATAEDQGVRVAWDTERWKKVDGGLEMIHPSTPSNPISGRDRYAAWATFQNLENNAVVSVISTHWNTSSENNPARAKLAGENLSTLTSTLQSKGSVFVGGDFNFPISQFNASHSPAQALKPLGLQSAFSKPEDKDVNIDSIFYPKEFTVGKKETYSKSKTSRISDHPFIVASFGGSSAAGVADSGGCVCEVSNLSSTALVGSKNDEKVFNYFKSKGLSDIQTAGIMGNMAIESGFDPENVQNKTSDAAKYGERTKDPKPLTAGWGLIQWTPGSKVITAAKEAGVGDQPIYELATQLDIVWGHLQNKPPITKGSFSIPEFKKITDVEKAVNYFEDKIEGAGKPNYTDRYTAARLALDQFSGKTSTSSAGSTGGSTVGDCESLDSGAAAGNAVQTALNYAWPEYHKPNYTKLKPAYAKAVSTAQKNGKYVGGGTNPGVDCGGFVTRVMQDSGVDTDYGGGGNTDSQEKHLMESGKYKKIENPTSADLTPGAIAISSDYGGDGGGHTYMFVGKQAGFETQIASASYSPSNTAWRAPMAGHEVVADPSYNWYVLK